MTTDDPARLLVQRDGRVLHLIISNPSARNALHPDMYRTAIAALSEVERDDGIGAIVLSGEGEHFCGGGNLHRLQSQRDQPPQGQLDNLGALHEWVIAIRNAPHPVIAAVEGAAAGGGFSLCLGCDLIVAAEDARFVMSYARIGLTPDGGASDSLAQALPHQAALEILLDGSVVSAARLQQWGVVNRVVPPGTAVFTALEWAARLANGPRLAHQNIKRLVYAARHQTRVQQLDAERESFVAALYGDEGGEGIAAFLEKRIPDYLTLPKQKPIQ